MRARLLPGLGFALLYWAVGYPAIHLAIPPGYTAPFFPPAGIALAALFVFGLRLWPAVFAGSALIQLATAWPLLGSPGWNLLGPLAVPAGATLQAVVGAVLARRLLAPEDKLDTAGSVMRFLGVCVPLSGLVCSTIGVSALVQAGVIPAADAFFNWWTWWTGDTLGMLVAAPLTLVFIGRPAQDWRPRRLGVALPMSIALVLLALAYQQVVSWENSRLRAQFERDSVHLSGLLQKRLEEQVDMVRSIERLLLASDHVSRSDFHEFVAPWMQRHPGTRSFTWNQHLPHAARTAFEEAMRDEYQTDFRVLDRDAAVGKIVQQPPGLAPLAHRVGNRQHRHLPRAPQPRHRPPHGAGRLAPSVPGDRRRGVRRWDVVGDQRRALLVDQHLLEGVREEAAAARGARRPNHHVGQARGDPQPQPVVAGDVVEALVAVVEPRQGRARIGLSDPRGLFQLADRQRRRADARLIDPGDQFAGRRRGVGRAHRRGERLGQRPGHGEGPGVGASARQRGENAGPVHFPEISATHGPEILAR